MATLGEVNIDIDPGLQYEQYQIQQVSQTTTNIEGTTVSPVTTINGNSGNVGGPSVTVSGGVTGYTFVGSGNSLTLTVSNAATIRSAISAAKSGVNTDITELNGASQVDVSARYEVGGTKVVGAQGAAVADASGGVTIDAEARTAINDLLARLRAHGLIAT